MVNMQHLPLLKGISWRGPIFALCTVTFKLRLKIGTFLFDGLQSLGLANFSLLLDHALLVFATDLLYHDFL